MYRKEYIAYFVLMLLALAILVVARISGGRGYESVVVEVPEDSVAVAWRFRNDSIHINTASAIQLRRFGFSNREVVSILSYRDAGGVIRNVEKLKQIYGVDTVRLARCYTYIIYDDVKVPYKRMYDNSYRRVFDKNGYADGSKSGRKVRRVGLYYADSAELVSAGMRPEAWDSFADYRRRYILKGSVAFDSLVSANVSDIGEMLAGHIGGEKFVKTRREEAKRVSVDLNVAGIEELCGVKMIGEKTAKAIVDYREKLGGFVSVEQLHEVWMVENFGSYDVIAEQCHVEGASGVRLLRVNYATEKELARHPYFTRRVIEALMMYRMSKGVINSADDFRKAMGQVDYNSFVVEYLSFK